MRQNRVRDLSVDDKAKGASFAISVALHLLVLGGILYTTRPVFVRLSSVAAGKNGQVTTLLYWRSSPFKSEAALRVHPTGPQLQARAAATSLVWSGIPKNKYERTVVHPEAAGKSSRRASVAQTSRLAAGSPYSLTPVGIYSGDEVRPALWATGLDPALSTNDLGGVIGNEIIEVTIDERGNIVQKTVLQSLGPQIDLTVLATLESWRFVPALRNGRPIASKQDLHFHFGKEPS